MKTLIREYRNRLGLTQEELAEMVGVTRQTIIALERGRYNPSLILAHRITRALGVEHIEDIFLLDEDG
ncbi:helix-turn-helix transcriptional regulator [Methanothermobacter sp. KEPCO-1]|uniref:helix-turn-helix transcriptional regulator n=1 Tax=Methanothermobacter TaxID=145260 RepID=UPI0011CA0162|nr:helix-turn-helix transcriptional regulator [Methanothermobacter sp. KEPCO-1]QEF94555.1 helix-turn-helix transcriptional regulator [Methanothermobacter sp. KEPCO-1]